MQTPSSITTTIAHRKTIKHGWLFNTRVSITMGEEAWTNSSDGNTSTTFPPTVYSTLLEVWTAQADRIGRAESERRNVIEGWKPQEIQ